MAKNGDFVGQFTRQMTKEEVNQFKSILRKAFNYAGIEYTSIKFTRPDEAAEKNYFGCGSAWFTVELPQTIAFKKGQDTVYNVSKIKFSVQPELGFSTYEKLQEVHKSTGGRLGYGKDAFDSFEWTVSALSDGRYHEYRHRHEHDYLYEGKDHYMYFTELEEFLADIQFYLTKNYPPTSSWK